MAIAKDLWQINGQSIPAPDEFTPSLAVTSTSGSGRTEDMVMHNSVMGTVQAYDWKWKSIPIKKAGRIVRLCVGRNKVKVKYIDAVLGAWAEANMYVANVSYGTLKWSNDEYVWEELSFQTTGIDPV